VEPNWDLNSNVAIETFDGRCKVFVLIVDERQFALPEQLRSRQKRMNKKRILGKNRNFTPGAYD
jgi:hypothetical protein